MHRAGDARVNVAAGRYLAQHIDGARYVELPGNDHLFCAGQSQRIVDEIEEFLTGLKSCLMTWAESCLVLPWGEPSWRAQARFWPQACLEIWSPAPDSTLKAGASMPSKGWGTGL